MVKKKSTIVSTNLAAHEAGTTEHPRRSLRETFIILGGRPYEATRTNHIESRDMRIGEFQQITRLYNKDRAAVRWAKDEGCARSIDWLVSIDPKMDVLLRLEGAQKNLKDGRGGSIEERTEIATWKNELKNYAEKVFKHPVRENNTMIEHERSGPRKAIFKVKRTRSDINLKRCHLVLACWATCQRLLLTPCHLNQFQDFATACEELHKAVHEKVPSHSFGNILLEGGEETIDIPSLHALVPHASATGVRSTVKGCPTLEQEIKATWVKGMVSRRSYCCDSHLEMEILLLGKEGKDVLWKSLRIRTHHPHHSMHSVCNSQPSLITEVEERDGRWARMQEVFDESDSTLLASEHD